MSFLQKMQFTIAPKNNPLIITNTPRIQVQKIVAVYQLKYKNGGIYGLGDFIRGCISLLQLCKDLNLDFDIDLSNHPLSRYIEGHIKTSKIDYNNISKIEVTDNLNYPKIFYKTYKYLLQNLNNEVYATTTNTPPFFEINQLDIEFIKSRLIPNVQFQYELDETMTTLGLKNCEFLVIHIRVGDNYLFNNIEVPQNIVSSLFNNLTPLLNDKTRKYLILSDSTKLKMLFKSYENCVFHQKKITHLGEHTVLTGDAVKNTLMDFYLMSQALHIYSYSGYGNYGSGFSKWVAVLYNIPYDTYYINNDNNTI